MPENFQDIFPPDRPGVMLGICAYCQKELGIDGKKIQAAGWSISHTVCKRHYLQLFPNFKSDAEKYPEVKARLDKVEKSNIRDLAEPENKSLVDWMKNPPQAKAAEPVAAVAEATFIRVDGNRFVLR